MIAVSRQSVRADVARARAIVAQGGTCLFTGSSRQLDRLSKALRGDEGTDVFLGDDGNTTVLCVCAASDTHGSLQRRSHCARRNRSDGAAA